MQPLYATALCNPVSYTKQYVTALGNRLWKRYVTACLVTYPVMQPLYATLLSYPKQYVTALGNRLWKRYVTACLVTYPVMQPLMETVLVLPKSLVRRCKTL
jgi:hypothetical protein